MHEFVLKMGLVCNFICASYVHDEVRQINQYPYRTETGSRCLETNTWTKSGGGGGCGIARGSVDGFSIDLYMVYWTRDTGCSTQQLCMCSAVMPGIFERIPHTHHTSAILL